MHPKNKYFAPKIMFWFHKTILIWTNSSAFISDLTMVFFKDLSKNTQVKYFRSQISNFLVLREALHFDKFEGTDFKHDNSFLKIAVQNTQIRRISFQI